MRVDAMRANLEADHNLRVALGAHYGTGSRKVSIAVGIIGGGVLLAVLGGFLSAHWMVWAILSMALVPLIGMLLNPVAGSSRVESEASWLGSRLFPIEGYFEALGARPHAATALLARVSFSDTVPPLELVQGLLGRADPRGTVLMQGAELVLHGTPISGATGISQGKVPLYRNHRLIPYVHALVDEVLSPLHARYPIDRVELTRTP